MKNVNILIVILTLAIATVSCETYDDYNADRKSIIRFTKVIPRPGVSPTDNANVSLSLGDTTRRIVEAFVSDVSNVDRTYNVIIDQETNEINPENVSFQSTITIPANERRTNIDINIENISLPEAFGNFAITIQEIDDKLVGLPFFLRLKE
ncbi:MAG: hypothetical protein Q8O62_01290 [Aequorivita sp.]|nr:hypothetical protein [Aequorivita sp.]